MELIRTTVGAGQCRAMSAILRTQAGQMVIDAPRGVGIAETLVQACVWLVPAPVRT